MGSEDRAREGEGTTTRFLLLLLPAATAAEVEEVAMVVYVGCAMRVVNGTGGGGAFVDGARLCVLRVVDEVEVTVVRI